MKTRQLKALAWLTAAMLASSGCDGMSGGEGRDAAPATNAAEGVLSTASTNAAAETSTNGPSAITTAGEAAGPAIRRSAPTPVPLRPELAEVVELIESGAGEEVTRAYVSASSFAYELSLEDITYLRDIGIPDGVIAAMMRRGAELRSEEAESERQQTGLMAAVSELKAAMATNAPAPQAAAVEAPAETPPVAATAPSPPAEAPAQVQQFYTELSPYGAWYQVPTYGWVWQPTVVTVNPLWAPYRHGGRWLWTDYGWYWCSDYSWGWAPFHYGRWCTYPGIGWCWVPDTVWGPSWVTWRTSGSYVGWAPLPPACGWSAGIGLTWYGSGVSLGFGFGLGASYYSFVPYHSFCYRSVGHHVVHHREAENLYKNSTVVNNVINGNNNVIINNGVGYNNVASQTRGEVPKARVAELPVDSGAPIRADRLERGKDGLVVYKPAVVESAGRPTLRSEVRPTGYASSASTGAPRLENRPGSRSGGTRSPAVGRPRADQPSTVYGKPVAPASRPSVGTAGTRSQPAAVTPRAPTTASVEGKTIESRSGSRLIDPSQPRRQTTPVPLGDPSRNIPARTPQVSRPSPTIAPTAPTAPTSPVAPSAPTATGRERVGTRYAPQTAPRSVGGVPYTPAPVAPRSSVTSPSGVSQFGTPSARTEAPRFTAPARPAISAPSPATAPRPSYSAPAPAMSAPRPSFSAPSPAMPAPRPQMSAPSPTMSVPRASVPAPSAVGRAPSGPVQSPAGRTQTN